MPPKRVRSLRCPICKTRVVRTAPDFPFCCERCRRMDLGKWASGRYVVFTPIAEPEAAPPEPRGSSQDDNGS